MDLKKRLDHGQNGFQVAVVPKAPRSLRRFKKKVEDGQICAFELLASVAGKLLQEWENSSTSSNDAEVKHPPIVGSDAVKQEKQEDDNILKSESAIVSDFSSQDRNKYSIKDFPRVENHVVLEHASTVSNSHYSDKYGINLKAEKYESKIGIKTESEARENGLNVKHSSLVSSERNPLPSTSFHRHRSNVNVDIRDDDENYYRFKQSSTKVNPLRPSPNVRDSRIKKMLTSKYLKKTPKLNQFDCRKIDRETHRVCSGSNRKTKYRSEIFQHDRPFKKRNMFEHNSVVSSDGDKSDSEDLLCEANGAPSSVRGHKAAFHSRDSKVRFSIKSFRVPELFIEVPENATIASLKRTVMEAVARILDSGLDVGVLVKGKKIKDDNRTLLQTGISNNDNLDTLGFTLEPGTNVKPPPPSPLCVKDSPFLLACDTPLHLTRSPPATKLLESGDSDASSHPVPGSDLGNHNVENDYALVQSPTTVTKTRALIPVPAAMNVKALSAVPMNQKLRRSELAQRRIRRPFSVTEVESLVHAVEKLGTGRWRDVKLRAFEDANHRTYVDLKDKWKTLVHTAQISPQQRRGEPVPQELLDRVLAAHSYWSHNQTKHHSAKHQPPTLKIADAQMG